MLKYLFIITLLTLSHMHARSEELSPSNVEALRIIAARKGLTRLDYDDYSKKWSYFHNSMINSFKRFVFSKNRHSILNPLENLVTDVEKSYLPWVSKDHENYHVLRRTYSSLSSLYSFYKINPDKDAAKQEVFLTRFRNILERLRYIFDDLNSKFLTRDLYKPTPWFGDEGKDVKNNDEDLGLHYLDMGSKGLAELNKSLSKIGNDSTQIDRAMEFYPSWQRKTSYHSSQAGHVVKKPVLFIVHGTFAAKSDEYLSDKHILFQQTKYMAQSIANDQNVPVEVYSFGWNGSNDNVSRMDAGVELANFVNTFFPKEEYCDFYIGHSHGGNVIFHFAKTVRYTRTPHTVITLATPIRKDFITDNINYLFEFYTEGDFVQYAGSYEMTSRNGSGTSHSQSPRKVLRSDIEKLGYFKNNHRFDEVKIYASKVLHNKKTPSGMIKSHSDLKYMISILPRIIDDLLRHKPNSEFTVNIDLDETKGLNVKEIDSLQYQIQAH